MITAVLFDLFETLITESGIQPTRASHLAPTLGLERDAYRKEWKMRRPSIVRGQMAFAEPLTEISQTLMGRADQAAIQSICQQRIREKAVAYARIHDGVVALVNTLARSGVGLAVISNGFEEDVLGGHVVHWRPKSAALRSRAWRHRQTRSRDLPTSATSVGR
jgi:phosphoserine phosphatase